MKKLLVAGASAAVLAAMPVAATFAADYTDTLSLKIANACTIVRDTTNGHTNGTGMWGDDGDAATTTDAADTLYATVVNGQSYANLGKSKFEINCNNKGGYSVTVDASAMTATGTAANAQGDYAWGYTAGGTNVTTGDSMWTIATTGDNADLADNIVSKNEAPVSAKTFEVTYMAFVDSTQPADTYTATAAYTLNQL